MGIFDELGVKTSTGKPFVHELLPDDSFIPCYVAADPTLGTRTNPTTQEVEPCLEWVLKTITYKRESDGEPFVLFLKTGVSFGSENAHLTQLITALYGQKPTIEEFKAIRPGDLVGKTVSVMVNYYDSKDKYTGGIVKKNGIDRSKGFKTPRTPFNAGVDFQVVPFARKEKSEYPPEPPRAGFTSSGKVVMPAPPPPASVVVGSPADEFDLEDPFAKDDSV